jgi:hypothetical protein
MIVDDDSRAFKKEFGLYSGKHLAELPGAPSAERAPVPDEQAAPGHVVKLPAEAAS